MQKKFAKVLTIQTQVFEVTISKVVFHDCHERGHLAEEQHFVVGGPQLGEDSVQDLKLPRSSVQVGTGGDRGELVPQSDSVCSSTAGTYPWTIPPEKPKCSEKDSCRPKKDYDRGLRLVTFFLGTWFVDLKP